MAIAECGNADLSNIRLEDSCAPARPLSAPRPFYSSLVPLQPAHRSSLEEHMDLRCDGIYG
jgi:hypothetical protein